MFDVGVFQYMHILLVEVFLHSKSASPCLLFVLLQSNDVDLESDRHSPPRLIIITDDNKICDTIIVVDGIQLNAFRGPRLAEGRVLCAILLNLMAVYYVWDLAYPKQYQLLLFLQLHLLNDEKDKAGLFKSVAFTKFEKIFLSAN